MAGRILPMALATVMGITIGVATFDGEFRHQRQKRIEEEYKREVAAVSALNSEGPSPMGSSAINPPAHEKIPSPPDAAKASRSSLSHLLGFWAWDSPKTRSNTANSPQPKPVEQDVKRPQQ